MTAPTFRNLLESGDVEGCRAYWRQHAGKMPQPETREQAEIVMHHARTGAESISFRARAWSHRWLVERDLPSALPDRLRPRAEQIWAVRKTGVGISVNFRSAFMKGAEAEVRGAMEAAVLEADAHGRIEDAAFVSARMAEAKAGALRALFGNR